MAASTIMTNVCQSAMIRRAPALQGITPGELIYKVWDATAVTGGLKVLDVDGGESLSYVAVEKNPFEKDAIDIVYSSGDQVEHKVAARGDIMKCWLAPSQVCEIGTYLCSNGDGSFKVFSAAAKELVSIAISTEKITSGASPIRINVEFI